jgi:hypothetical protein
LVGSRSDCYLAVPQSFFIWLLAGITAPEEKVIWCELLPLLLRSCPCSYLF